MSDQRCEFTGSLADQVFRCRHCDAFPEDCSDGDCCCGREPVEPCPHICSCTSDVECPHDCPCEDRS